MNTPEKRLITDYSEDIQPKGSYPYARNSVAESAQGELGWLITELGNTKTLEFPQSLSLIGAIKGDVNEVYVFLTDNTTHEIGKITNYEEYETLINTSCLNFNLNFPIKGQYKNRNNCEKVIIFHDENNLPRYIDVENLDAYKTDGVWDCKKMRFFSAYSQPYASNIQVNNTGGRIPLGTIQFTFQYSMGQISTTPFSTPTNVIPIVNEPIDNWRNIDGGKFTQEGFTNKSITLSLSNIDTNFEYINIIVIESREGIKTAYLADTIGIDSASLTYTYTGLNYDTAELLNTSSLTQLTSIYDTVKESALINNRLLFMGIKEKDVPHSSLQQAANNIQTTYVTKAVRYQNMADANSRNPQNYIQLQSHMRDEVVALGIRFKYDDGYITPTYHIPGRSKDKYANGSTINVATGNANSHSRPNAINNWDSDIIKSSEDTKHITFCEGINSPASTCADVSYGITYGVIGSNAVGWSTGASVSGTITIIYRDNSPGSPTTYTESDVMSGTSGSFTPSTHPGDARVFIEMSFSVGDCDYHVLQEVTAPQTVTGTAVSTTNTAVDFERWQVYNTAIRTEINTLSSEYYTKGEMGYYQTCEINYPDDVDCNGQRIYPEGKIRHHRLPDTTLEESWIVDNEPYTISLGIQFNSIQYPDPDIVGHEFMIATVDESNKTVIDKGIAYFNIEIEDSAADEIYTQTSGGNFESINFSNYSGTATATNYLKSNISFHSPVTKLKETQLSADYIKIERYYTGDIDIYSNPRLGVIRYNESSIPTETNRIITNQTYIQDGTTLSGTYTKEFVNTVRLETFVASTEDNLNDPTGWSPIIGDSATAPSKDYCHYVSFKKYVPNAYSDLTALTYRPLYHIPSTNTTFGGDAHISRLAFRKTFRDPTAAVTPSGTGTSFVPWFFCESRINADLRHSEDGTSLPTQYFPKHFDTDAEILTFLEQTNEVPNHYRYNDDFSNVNDIIPSFPLYRNFDWCTDCNKEFPYRQAWSDEDLHELYDSNRVFRPNNYKDIPTNGGPIQSAFIKDYQLFIRTTESLWIQPTSAEQLVASNSLIYLGTGEFLEQDARELVSSENASVGGYTKYTNLRNENGVLIINDIKGDIYLFSETLTPITTGNRNFFKNHLPVKLYDQFYTLTGLSFPKDNPFKHVGVTAAYDDRHSRFIITKRDFKIIPNKFAGLLSEAGLEDAGKMVWDTDTKTFKVITLTESATPTINAVDVEYTNQDYFENISFTISYFVLENAWISFHSYVPNYYISLPNKFYSIIQDGNLWKHNTGNFQTYYNTRYPFIVHQIYNEGPTQDKVMNAIDYLTEVYEYDEQEQQWKELHYETFDEAIFWGTRQISGVQSIKVLDTEDPFASLNYAANEIYAERDGKLWNITGLRNLRSSGNISLFTKDWDDPTYRAAYPIDKVPNIDAYDYTMSQFDMTPIKDRFLNMRFYYYNDKNRKLVFKLTDTKVFPNVT